MNVTDDTERQAAALAAYHANYQNDSYLRVQVALVQDLWGAFPSGEIQALNAALATEPSHSILNLLTDTCLEISGHPLMQGRVQRLIRALVDAKVGEEVVRLMGQHMEHFESDASSFSADFENSCLVLLRLQSIELYSAKAHSAAIHSRAGNIANDLLCSVQYLLQLSKLVLMNEDSSAYLNEKMWLAETHLSYAKASLTSMPAEIVAYKTLLLSEDKSYVGIVTKVKAGIAQILWYKWGYESPDTLSDWLPLSQIQRLILRPADCQKRFKALPPIYGKE